MQTGETWWFELTKVVLDKGILAAAIAWLGYTITRHLDRHRTQLAWNAEVTRERLHAAKRLHKAATILLRATAELRAEPRRETKQYEEYKRLAGEYNAQSTSFSLAVLEESIVLPKDLVIRFEAIETAAEKASESLKLNRFDEALDRLADLGDRINAAISEARKLLERPWS